MDSEETKFRQALRDSIFHDLDHEVKSSFLTKQVRVDRKQYEAGVKKVDWAGPVSEMEIIGKEVVGKTDVGNIVGKVVYFGKEARTSDHFIKTVVVFVPSSGTIYEVPSDSVRLADAEDIDRLKNDMQMASRIPAAEAAVLGDRKKRMKVNPGSHLFNMMIDKAKEKGLILDDKAGFIKIYSNTSNKSGGLDGKSFCVYIATKGGRADLSNFCINHPAVSQMSAEQAKEKHLGKVRGQVDFNRQDDQILEAWDLILKTLGS